MTGGDKKRYCSVTYVQERTKRCTELEGDDYGALNIRQWEGVIQAPMTGGIYASVYVGLRDKPPEIPRIRTKSQQKINIHFLSTQSRQPSVLLYLLALL